MTSLRSLGSLVAIITMASLAVGCTSTGSSSASQGYKRASITGRQVQEASADMRQAKAAITQTVDAMDSLINTPQVNMEPQYKAFSSKVDDLNRRSEKARDRAVDLRAKREEYLSTWRMQAEQIASPDLRQRAIDRMAQIRGDFDQLAAKARAAREAFGPFQTDLNDVRRYLGSDLTPGGVASISDLVEKTRREEQAVQSALDALIAELDRVAADISAKAPAP
jgi:hypothetical protein